MGILCEKKKESNHFWLLTRAFREVVGRVEVLCVLPRIYKGLLSISFFLFATRVQSPHYFFR